MSRRTCRRADSSADSSSWLSSEEGSTSLCETEHCYCSCGKSEIHVKSSKRKMSCQVRRRMRNRRSLTALLICADSSDSESSDSTYRPTTSSDSSSALSSSSDSSSGCSSSGCSSTSSEELLDELDELCSTGSGSDSEEPSTEYESISSVDSDDDLSLVYAGD